MIEPPVCYRVSWDRFDGFRYRKRPPPARRDFPTHAEAEAYKRSIKAMWGDQIVACVMPIYISRTKRDKRLATLQTNAASHWPLQHRSQEA